MKLPTLTLTFHGKRMRLEERADGLWYLADPEDQAKLGAHGKPYHDWYEMSDSVIHPPSWTRMCRS